MINVSTEFKELMKSRTDFKQYAEVTLTDGAVWALDDSDFRITGNSVSDGAGVSELPLGVVVGRSIKMTIENSDDRFADVAFLGAEIRLYLTFQLSETVERVEFGVFTVISPENYGETISIQAVDNAWKLDTPYTTTLQYPQTTGAVFRDICTRCSVLAESSDFLNNDFVIESAPDSGITNREMIGYIAMIAGGNARFNRYGKLEILTYEFPTFELSDEADIYDGGSFEGWTAGEDIIDGGNFTDWNAEDIIDGGAFRPWNAGSVSDNIVVDSSTHVLANWISLKPFTEDVVITGIQTTKTVTDDEGNETETPVMYGADGYVISIENPLIAGKEEAALALIGDVLVGFRIRNFEGEHIAYPLAEFMDKAVLVDRKGNAAPTVLTDINFNFFGITTMKNSAAPPLRLSSKYNSAAAQAIIAAKNLVAKEKTQRELAIKNLTETLEAGSGLFPTEVEQPDGSIITYLHNKPTLEESDTILVVTSEGIGISTDFGETYTTGLLFTGDAVLKTLQTEGINADWINTGAFVIEDAKGNIVFNADADSKTVVIQGKYFTLNSDGSITATNATITGTINANDGTIGGFTISGTRLFTEDHENPAGDYVPGIVLDTENGVISVGAGQFKSNSEGVAKFGTESKYIVFDEYNDLFDYDINFHGTVSIPDEAYFGGDVTFKNTPSFPSALPVKSGGTGKNSFTQYAVLLGNGTDPILNRATLSGAFYATEGGGLPSFGTLPVEQGGTGATDAEMARKNLGIIGGSITITPSTTNAYVDSAAISLTNVEDYAITVTPRGNTGVAMQMSVYNSGDNAFKIRVYKVASWSGGAQSFDWIAVKKS